MGQKQSQSPCQEEFVFVYNDLPENFIFDPSESSVVSVGIDQQSSPRFKKHLGHVAANDAKAIVDSLVNVRAIPSTNAHLFTASQQPEDCTSRPEGLKRIFQTYAREVGPEGLFVFHFAGHCIQISDNKWGLAPMNFDGTATTLITADVLSEWLNEIQCEAKYILLSLDCCYADGIGTMLVHLPKLERNGLFIASACTASEKASALESLGNSIFSYFFSYYIEKLAQNPGDLPIKEIFSECQVSCECLSSVMMSYSEESGFQRKSMRPQIAVKNIAYDQCDGEIGRFAYIMELYDQRLKKDQLDEKSILYLDSLKYGRDESECPLVQLGNRGLLNEKVTLTIMCSIMYSLASIELACDTESHVKVKNHNLCLTAFMQAASTIEMIHSDVQFDRNIFRESVGYYKEVMMKNKVVDVEGWQDFEAKLEMLDSSPPTVESDSAPQQARGVDMTDYDGFGTISDEVVSVKN